MINIDGKGQWDDNIWIERICRTIKYECIFLSEVESLAEIKAQLNTYINYYKNRRLHSSLDYKTPTNYYDNDLELNKNNDMVLWLQR